MNWPLLSRLRPLLQRTEYTRQRSVPDQQSLDTERQIARRLAAAAGRLAEREAAGLTEATEARQRAASAERQAEAAIAYAAERDALAKRAGDLLEERQKRVEELAAEVVAYKRAIGVLATQLGEAHAYLLGDGRNEYLVAELAAARMPLFGTLGMEYIHKLTGDRIRLTTRNAPREWSYSLAGSDVVWPIWDDDLGNEYTPAATGVVTVLMQIGGGS